MTAVVDAPTVLDVSALVGPVGEIPCGNRLRHIDDAPAARWLMICRACGNDSPRCDECKSRIEVPRLVHCIRCKVGFTTPDGLRFVPIPRGGAR